jgi:predicted DNA-binding transcriptional regulator YafY
MSTQATIRSYYLIIERLRSSRKPTKKELFEYLSDEGLVNSMRSLERRIEEIRTEFHLKIPYAAATNTYSLSDIDLQSLDTILRFLEMNAVSGLFGDSFRNSKEAIKHVSFDSDGSFHGLHNLKPLLNAIQARHLISFTYLKFDEDAGKFIQAFCPLLLREYLGRWYIAGTFLDSDFLYTYGLDRMSSLSIAEETFNPSLIDPSSRFDSVIGISIMEPKKVLLSFSSYQAKYIKTLPLHKSQVIVSENDNEVIFGLFIAPNYELLQRILMYGKEVRVLEPESLANQVKEVLAESIKKYI